MSRARDWGRVGRRQGTCQDGGFFPEDSHLLRFSCEFIWLFSLWALGLTVVPKDSDQRLWFLSWMCSVRLWPLAYGAWVQIQTAILNVYHRGKLLHLRLDALTRKAAWEVKHATPHWAAAQAKPIGYVRRSVAVQKEDAVC